MIYLQLLYSFLKIGFFGFGGGYAMLSLIYSEIVENHAWLSDKQFTDIVAISQMTPGPIAINSATYVGYSVTGSVWGAVVATFAVCVPPMTLMLLITKFYLSFRDNRYVSFALEGMKPMLIAMIGAAALLLMTPANFTDYGSAAIFIGCGAAALSKANPIFIIVASAIVGILIY